MIGEIFGYYLPKPAIVWIGICIGFVIGLWAQMLYKHPLIIGVLSSVLFYVVYGAIVYLLVIRKKQK